MRMFLSHLVSICIAPFLKEVCEELLHASMPYLRQFAPGRRVHLIFELEQLFVKVGDGGPSIVRGINEDVLKGKVLAGNIHRTITGAAEGKGAGDADRSHCFQTIGVLMNTQCGSEAGDGRRIVDVVPADNLDDLFSLGELKASCGQLFCDQRKCLLTEMRFPRLLLPGTTEIVHKGCSKEEFAIDFGKVGCGDSIGQFRDSETVEKIVPAGGGFKEVLCG